MEEQNERNSYLRPWCVVLLSALALSVVIEVVGAASLPSSLRSAEDQLHGAKDDTRFEADASAGLSTNRQSDGASKSNMVQTVQFMLHPDFAEGPMPGRMVPPPFPDREPGSSDRLPPKLAPRSRCLEDINRHMAIYGYIRSKLQLTENQKAAAKAVDDALQSSVGKLQVLCQTLPNDMAPPPGLMEGADFMEKQLSARLDLLHALKAPMQDLFTQLSPDQRAVLDAPPPFPPF
jgi:hypothetical protein